MLLDNWMNTPKTTDQILSFVNDKLFRMKYFKESITVEELETLLEELSMVACQDVNEAVEALEGCEKCDQ
jgi:hypothetical protein